MEHSATGEIVAGLAVLMLLAAAMLWLCDRLRFPFSIALLVLGMLLARLVEVSPAAYSLFGHLEISADLIIYVFLPTLVYESACHLDWRQLRKDLVPVLLLAVPGLLLSMTIIGYALHWLTGMALAPALLLGAILSATDPVAVIALFQRLGAPLRLTILVEGESLLNDATAIVVSRILVGLVAAGSVSLGDLGGGVLSFFGVFFGGIAVGLVMGELAAWVLGRVRSDPAIVITVTMVLAYGSFLIAEEGFHASGVMAALTAGLCYGSHGWMRVAGGVRGYLNHFWSYLAFVATALIFLMVGLRVELTMLPGLWAELACLYGAMLAARALLVYGGLPLVNRLPGAQYVSVRYRSIMFWGGLRGAIGLALVLSLPPDFPLKEEFIALGTGAVLLTLFLQGLSIDSLVTRLGLATPPLPDRVGEAETEVHAKQQALARLPELSAGGLFSSAIAQKLSQRYRREHREAEQQLADLRRAEVDPAAEKNLVFLRALAEERESLRRLFGHGHLDERPFRRLLAQNAALIDDLRHDLPAPAQRLALGGQRLVTWLARLPQLGPLVEYLRQHNVAIAYQVAWGQFQTCSAVLEQLDSIAPQATNSANRDALRQLYTDWRDEACAYLDETAEQFPEFVHAMQERHATRLAVLSEITAIEERARHGSLPSSSAARMELLRDAELDQLRSIDAEKLHIEPGEFLRKVPFFADLPAEALPLIVERLHQRTYATGEKIIRQGHRDDSMFLIARGVVRVYLYVDDVKRNVATLMAGDFFGEMAMLSREPRTATVIAVTPCLVFELKRPDFMAVARLCEPLAEVVQRTERERRAELAAG